ncbi:MAG: selenium metabolism-associated LysR family transcriptional regulator [Clostridium sp.]
MEFRQIEAFVNAVKYKSFSKAADATFLTQPTISAHISNLENELEITLLNRVGREVTLTPQGQQFYPYALDILHTRSKALASVENGKDLGDGVIDIQASTIPGQYFLPGMLSKFRSLHSGARFYVEQSDSRNVNENILNQKGELGFTGFRGNDSLEYEPIFKDNLVFIVPNSEKYREYESGSMVSAELFKDEAFILREDGSGTKQEMEMADFRGEIIFKHMNVAARINNMETIRQTVAEGLGISVVSEMAALEENGRNRMKYFRIEELEKQRIFYMVHNKNICLSPLAESFRQLILEDRKIQ